MLHIPRLRLGITMGGRLRKMVISVVTLVWGANFLAPLWIQDFKPIAELNVAFMGIITMLLAGGHQSGGQGGNQPPIANRTPTRTDNHDPQGSRQTE